MIKRQDPEEDPIGLPFPTQQRLQNDQHLSASPEDKKNQLPPLAKPPLQSAAQPPEQKDNTELNRDLREAANKGDLKKVQSCLKQGAEVDSVVELEEQTALHIAARKGHSQIVQLLLEHGADIERRNKFNSTALHLAAAEGHVEIVKPLLEKGNSKGEVVNAKNNFDATALYEAAVGGHVDVVKLLVKHHADVTAQAKNGMTALEIANDVMKSAVLKKEQYAAIVKLLAEEPDAKLVVSSPAIPSPSEQAAPSAAAVPPTPLIQSEGQDNKSIKPQMSPGGSAHLMGVQGVFKKPDIEDLLKQDAKPNPVNDELVKKCKQQMEAANIKNYESPEAKRYIENFKAINIMLCDTLNELRLIEHINSPQVNGIIENLALDFSNKDEDAYEDLNGDLIALIQSIKEDLVKELVQSPATPPTQDAGCGVQEMR